MLVYPRTAAPAGVVHGAELPRPATSRPRSATWPHAACVFEKYAGTEMATDDLGVFRKGGPLIAWFADPAGNVLSLIEQPEG